MQRIFEDNEAHNYNIQDNELSDTIFPEKKNCLSNKKLKKHDHKDQKERRKRQADSSTNQ